MPVVDGDILVGIISRGDVMRFLAPTAKEHALLGPVWKKQDRSPSIFRERRMKSKTNVAVIGSGNKCRELLNRFEKHDFGALHPVVVAVVDMGDGGPCVTKAEEPASVTNDPERSSTARILT
jgi:hypothetical protein